MLKYLGANSWLTCNLHTHTYPVPLSFLLLWVVWKSFFSTKNLIPTRSPFPNATALVIFKNINHTLSQAMWQMLHLTWLKLSTFKCHLIKVGFLGGHSNNVSTIHECKNIKQVMGKECQTFGGSNPAFFSA